MEQQREAGTLGMWVFLLTEIMFFGGAFTAYIIYRGVFYPKELALASHSLNVTIGTINTIVLICSSLTMALAVYYAQTGVRKLQVTFLLLTLLLGTTFLVIKGFEYYDKFVEHHIPGRTFHFEGVQPDTERHMQIYFVIYFALTGLHALHMIIGIGILLVITRMAWKGRFSPEWHAPVELFGLYWHFVDIVWIFLFPLLYLIGAHEQGGGH